MQETYSVSIPVDQTINFPKRCAHCGEPCSETGSIRGNPDSSYWGGWKYLFGFTETIELRIYNSCRRLLTRKLRLRNLALFSIALLAIIFFFNIEITIKNKIIVSSFAFFFIFLAAYWQVKNPTSFSFKKNEGMLEFDMTNRTYAVELSRLNDVIVE